MKTKEQVKTTDLRLFLKELMQREFEALPELLEQLEPKERINVSEENLALSASTERQTEDSERLHPLIAQYVPLPKAYEDMFPFPVIQHLVLLYHRLSVQMELVRWHRKKTERQ